MMLNGDVCTVLLYTVLFTMFSLQLFHFFLLLILLQILNKFRLNQNQSTLLVPKEIM